MRKVKFYRGNKDDSPVENFLLVNTDGIWEVRATLGSNTFRILDFMWESEFIVLTNGFSKKTQKVPRREIKLAESRKKKYIGGIK